MPADAAEIARRVVGHLLEINFGWCSITEQMILDEENDPAMGEILTGLLYLHEDLVLREERRAAADEQLRAAVARLERQHAVAVRLAAELRTAKEEAEAATASKSQFLAHMSHEVRTPLTALIGFSDLMFDAGVPEATRQNYGQIVRRNGQHLLAVIDDILDLSKIEAGKLDIEPMPCALIELLADLVSLMQVRANQRGLELSLEFVTDVPEFVITDPTRLRQILLNLVSNSIKFTVVGRVRIGVAYAQDLDTVTIEVTDTGIGMTPDQLTRAFEPFAQAESATVRRFGGSGLGLAISQRLAVALGATLTARSEVGKGSAFTLRLSAHVPAGTRRLRSLLERPASPSDLASGVAAATAPDRLVGRVLVAEDGPDNQLLLRTILEQRGLEVTVVDDGRKAIAAVLEAKRFGVPYDLILMDMEMPELDGYETTRQLVRIGIAAPIVALTAHAMAGQQEKCVQAGCRDYMSKPVDRRALIALVARYLPGDQLPNG
jgi:signal transduction histidine kinase/ActR/RegA family two-component response regulator